MVYKGVMLKKIFVLKKVGINEISVRDKNDGTFITLFLKKKNFFFNNVSFLNKIYFYLSKKYLDARFDNFSNFLHTFVFILKNSKFIFFKVKSLFFLNKILNVFFLKVGYFYFFKKFNFFFTVFNKKKVKSVKKNLKKKLKKQNSYLFF